MANLTSHQAVQLADNFYYLGMAIGEYRYANWDRLTLDENKELSSKQNSILRCGEDILAFATTLIMNEVVESLEKINTITQEIRETIKSLENIQKGLNVAAGILLLGTSILKRDPMGISNSIKEVIEAWKNPVV